LSSPSLATPFISYWVMIAPSASRFMIGTCSTSGSREITTAAACTPHWRRSPSRPAAVSSTWRASGSLSRAARSSAESLNASLRERSLPSTGGGMALARSSPSL
jgi:hypothetical protein